MIKIPELLGKIGYKLNQKGNILMSGVMFRIKTKKIEFLRNYDPW
jgi:hypothetical protein